MVLIHIKKGDESQFLYETSKETVVEGVLTSVVAIYNGRLKIQRICSELDELAQHGTMFPPEILGLTEDQVTELKLVDHWGETCVPSGGFTYVKDPLGRRNGKQPVKSMQNLIKNSATEAKGMISKSLVQQDRTLTLKCVQHALDILKGTVMMVYPMKLPPHDVIRMEFENIEDLSGTQASLDVIDPGKAQLWFCGRELFRDKPVKEYTGDNEKCKVIMKLSHKGQGPPGREPVMSEDERKQLMLHAYRKQEELKKLANNDDDSYLNSEWADSGILKRSCQGLRNISWRPK
ncbi:uncharacterized protein CBL_01034 [Carabus blaptoides fortunei]